VKKEKNIHKKFFQKKKINDIKYSRNRLFSTRNTFIPCLSNYYYQKILEFMGKIKQLFFSKNIPKKYKIGIKKITLTLTNFHVRKKPK